MNTPLLSSLFCHVIKDLCPIVKSDLGLNPSSSIYQLYVHKFLISWSSVLLFVRGANIRGHCIGLLYENVSTALSVVTDHKKELYSC